MEFPVNLQGSNEACSHWGRCQHGRGRSPFCDTRVGQPHHVVTSTEHLGKASSTVRFFFFFFFGGGGAGFPVSQAHKIRILLVSPTF